jgi:hypothetical protein
VKKIFKRERERENIQQPSFHPHPSYPSQNTWRAGGLQRRRAFFSRVKHVSPTGGGLIYLAANELHHLPRNLAPLSIGRLDPRNSLLVTLLGDYGGIISCEIAPLAARSPDGVFKNGLQISHLTCSLVFFLFFFCWCVVFVFFLLLRTPVSDGA